MSDLPTLPENVDRLSLSELEARYSIKTGALYERFKALGMERKGSGRPAFLSREEIDMMDELHLHLHRGGRFADFPRKVQQNSGAIESVAGKSLLSQFLHALPEFVETLARTDVFELLSVPLIKIGNAIFPPPLPPAKRGLELAYLRELEEAYRSGWLITTANLANLLGLTSHTVASYGNDFDDAGFTFSRVGRRKGGQIAWRVSKPNQIDVTALDLP